VKPAGRNQLHTVATSREFHSGSVEQHESTTQRGLNMLDVQAPFFIRIGSNEGITGRNAAGRSVVEGFPVVVHEGTNESMIAAINAAPRAMVFLTVAWSGPEQTARADFCKAVARLAEIGLLVEAFALDEDSEIGRRWLASLGLLLTFEGIGVPQGWGAVLWLEYGRVVWRVARGCDERAVGMIARSSALWQ
jgi:hypothetical protein